MQSNISFEIVINRKIESLLYFLKEDLGMKNTDRVSGINSDSAKFVWINELYTRTNSKGVKHIDPDYKNRYRLALYEGNSSLNDIPGGSVIQMTWPEEQREIMEVLKREFHFLILESHLKIIKKEIYD